MASMRFPIVAAILLLISLQLLREPVLVAGDFATATSYGPPYTPTQCHGNSREQFPGDYMFAAVSQGLWDKGAACGRQYEVKCLSGESRACKAGSIVVEVVDLCRATPCPANLLLSRDAFAAISSAPLAATINVQFLQI